MSKTLIRLSQQKLNSRNQKNHKPGFQMLMKNYSLLSKCDQRPESRSRYSQTSDQSSLSVYKKLQMKEFVKAFKENQERYHFLLRSSEPKTKNSIGPETNFKNQSIAQKGHISHITENHPLQDPIDKEIHTKALLEQYEKRIEEILKVKLLKKSQNKTILSSRIQKDQLEQELNKIIQQLKELGCEMSDDETDELLMLQIKEIDQRIVIFEKIIAESFTESEMLKRFYYARKCLRKSGTQRKQVSKMYRSCDNIGQYKNKNCSFPQTQVINFRTNNQLSFIKPKRQDYQPVKNCNKENRYAPKRQIFPKSSYQQQFKNYGILPTYKHRKSENYINFPVNQNRNSTYKGDYHQKSVKKFDSKALDCRKDKIKPGKIPFMGKQYSNAPQNQQYKVRKNKVSESTCQPLPHQNFRNSEYSGSLKMKTEYHWKFQGQKPSIASFIKDKNLSNLKVSYKKQVRI